MTNPTNKETWECGDCKEEVTPNGEHLCKKAWEEEFDKEFIASDGSVYFHGESSKDGSRITLKDFIRSLVKTERQAGIEEERENWINQPANEHDERIRQAEREYVLKKIEKIMEGKISYIDIEELQNLKEKLKEGE